MFTLRRQKVYAIKNYPVVGGVVLNICVYLVIKTNDKDNDVISIQK